MALDRYAANICIRFGLKSGDINTVFPNLRNLASPSIGLLR